jgi:hypothetical protein
LRENNNNYQDREQFYQKLSPCLIKLSQIVAIFEQSAPLIAKKQHIFLYPCAVTVNILSKSNKNFSFEEFN